MKYSTLIQISCASRKLVKQQVNKGVNMGSWTSYLFASLNQWHLYLMETMSSSIH